MFWKLMGQKIFYFLAILIVIGYWVAFTESGLIATLWVAKGFIPGTVSAEKVSGKWVGEVNIQTLCYESPTLTINAQEFTFKPEILALFDNKVTISHFQLKEGKIVFKGKPQDTLNIHESTGSLSLNSHGQLLFIQIENIQGSWFELPLNGYAKIKKENTQQYIPHIFLTWGDNQIKVVESLQKKNEIDLAFKIIHPNMNIELQGFLKAKETPHRWEGQLTLSPGRINLPFLKIKQRPFTYIGGKVHFVFNGNGLTAQLDFKQNNQNSISGELKTPPFSLLTQILEQPLEGSFTAHWNDLSLLYNVIPKITKLKGSIALTGQLEGTFKKPMLHLKASTKTTSFFIPKQNLKINRFNLDASGTLPGTLTLIGSGALGDGQFHLNGTSLLNDEFKTKLKITGKNIDIYNTPHTHIVATPDIMVDYIHPILYVQGIVHIPYANIILKNEKNQAVLSKDVILVNDKSTNETNNPFKVIPSLYLIIENQLHFVGYGIDGIIGGKLAIDQRPDGLLSGSGKLTIKEGKYRLQGATRYIHRGYLLFPPGTLLTDPILDIRILQKRTTEQPSDGDIGIYVQGTLQKPLLQPYSSNTNLQSSQILSRLGFGAAETTDENQRQIIAQTAFLLAGSSNPLVDFIQNNLELEEFNIESREIHKSFFNQGGTDTELVIGKSLTDKLYLQYIQSVLNPLTTIRLKYFLGRYFTISAETSSEEDVGGDLTFSMEKD